MRKEFVIHNTHIQLYEEWSYILKPCNWFDFHIIKLSFEFGYELFDLDMALFGFCISTRTFKDKNVAKTIKESLNK